ncbi:MAG: TonB-dependent receptor domain-containing protein, partial [Bdellovibrio sp.]
SISQDIPLNKDQQISLTLFEYHFSNLITTQGSNNNLKYVNANKTHTKGLELAYSVRPSPVSSLSISYGYQEPRDEDNNRWLARRPLVNGSIKYQHSWGLQIANIELIGVGERLDLIGNNNYTSLPGYITSNASYSYDLRNGFSAYTRLNNLFNHRYQDTYSYYTEGFSAVFGGEYWF